MRTPSLLLLAILLGAAVSLQSTADATKLLLGPAKTTHLHFFLHDTLSRKDSSAVLVARGGKRMPKPDDPLPFGSLYTTDDVLTEGPQRESKVVGNAQGLYISSGRAQLSLVLVMDFELTEGPFNGSAFVVYSQNTVVEHPVGRELAIVDGRGKFRMAQATPCSGRIT